jgi:chemotaxis-related protein WspD
MTACWSAIGVSGDRSCPELAEYVHCRNCPVHAAAASTVLQRAVPDGYLAEWTAHVARPVHAAEPQTDTAVVFRVRSEWLALPARVVTEVTEPRAVHSLPHVAGRALAGITSVRGELVIAVSLAMLIGIDDASDYEPAAGGYRRSMVIERDGLRAVCAVDELEGVHRYRGSDLREMPATLSRAPARFSTAFLPLGDRSVGLIDEQRLFDGIKRSLA